MATELMMTLREADRLAIVKRIQNKELNIGDGARELGISSRQMKRVWRRFKERGARGLLSLKKGKPSPNKIPNILRKKALRLVKKKYWDYGPTLASEKLEEKHGLKLSKETLRQLMIKEGLWKGKKRKEIKNHPRRTRRSRIGDMIQIDGSYEFWFEDRGEKCCLIVFIDDATSKIMLMRFYKAETSEDYLKMLSIYIEKYGRPLSLYSDKHSVFRVNKKELHEKGKWTTRFHEVLKELKIELICAHSPQAKGRVERANGTLQDRLIKELRERKICSMKEGNDFLDEYTEMHNKKFSAEPASSENAHQDILPSHNLEKLFIAKELGTCLSACKQWNQYANNEALWNVLVPENAFDPRQWNTYFGDIGEAPPVSRVIHQILNAPCPFWPGKRVHETHVLTLIPRTVNGQPFTLNRLSELSATKYRNYWNEVKKEYGNTAPAVSYWALMTKDVIPESQNKKYDAQKQLLATYSQKARLPYEVPHLLEAATGILMEHVQCGTRLYSASPLTFTRCQERVASTPNPLIVGGFAAVGLFVTRRYGIEHEHLGVGGCRVF